MLLPAAQLDGAARDLRPLVDHREDLVPERTRIINRLRWHLHELDPTWEPPTRSFDRAKTLDTARTRIAHRDGTVARLARSLVERCATLTAEFKDLEAEIAEKVGVQAPSLLEVPGCGSLTAAKVLGETADSAGSSPKTPSLASTELLHCRCGRRTIPASASAGSGTAS